MNLNISKRLLNQFPGIKIHLFAAHIKTTAQLLSDSKALLRDAQENILRNEAIASEKDDSIFLEWRNLYRTFGISASTFKCSAESLFRRVRSGRDVTTNLAIVNIYNSFSLRHRACIGAYDLERLPASKVTLRFCDIEKDIFRPLGGASDRFPLKENMIVYASDNNILCWALNCRDSALTSVTEDSTTLLFIAEALTDEQAKRANSALSDLRGELSRHGSTTEIVLIDGSKDWFYL